MLVFQNCRQCSFSKILGEKSTWNNKWTKKKKERKRAIIGFEQRQNKKESEVPPISGLQLQEKNINIIYFLALNDSVSHTCQYIIIHSTSGD